MQHLLRIDLCCNNNYGNDVTGTARELFVISFSFHDAIRNCPRLKSPLDRNMCQVTESPLDFMVHHEDI